MKKCPKCKGTGYIQDDAEIGKALSIKRRKALLTLREVSAKMDISISYLSDLEHGRKKWSAKLEQAYREAVEGE